MRRICALTMLALAAAAGDPKPEPSPRWAPSWDAAVEEARALNLPIVVHRHGFYWSPCWQMHRSVLQNKGYIDFAKKNTVEVISMEELETAVEKGEYLETYTEKDPYGDEVSYLVRFPGLTVEQLRDLSNGPAIEFMEGGRIPYTAIVDPHSGAQMEGVRGLKSAGDLMDLVKKHRKALDTKYGKGIDRDLWDRVAEGAVQADLKLGDGRIADALGVWRHLAELTVRQPEVLQRKADALKAVVLEAAAERLDALEAADASDADVRRELKELARALRDTELEARAQALASKK